MPFLSPDEQCYSTEEMLIDKLKCIYVKHFEQIGSIFSAMHVSVFWCVCALLYTEKSLLFIKKWVAKSDRIVRIFSYNFCSKDS